MKITPKTDEQIARENCMPVGDYDFEVMSAEDKISKNGNPMIVLSLNVFDSDGRPHPMKAYLMEKMAFQLRHFCFAVGMGAMYETGTLTAPECVGRTGRVSLKIEEQPGYLPKNAVRDFVVVDPNAPAAPNAAPRQPMATAAGNDEPPF